VMEGWSDGVMEGWSDGGVERGEVEWWRGGVME
jgi:hypothetical protein